LTFTVVVPMGGRLNVEVGLRTALGCMNVGATVAGWGMVKLFNKTFNSVGEKIADFVR
jgi:hypothetical protein